MLDGEQVTKLKQHLLQQQQLLLGIRETGEQAADTVKLDQTTVGRLSRMDALQGQAISLETQRRREIELLQIASALQRIADDSYGCCLRCGEEIELKRLEYNPATPLCIACASAAE